MLLTAHVPNMANHPHNADWSPDAWKACTATQQPSYPDVSELQSALAELASLPPLVTSWEIEALTSQIAEAQEGKRFLLQGGDCAETFDDCSSATIAGMSSDVAARMRLVMPLLRAAAPGLERLLA